MKDVKERIKRLEKTIQALDTAYHEKGDDCIDPFTEEVVSDNEYDALKKELLKLNPNSKIFKTVTAAKSKTIKNKIIHDPPMTSINKCNGTEVEKHDMLFKWIRDAQTSIPIQEIPKEFITHLKTNFCMSYKHDGLALSCEYENGYLKKAGLRSKSGMDGIDVTDKAKYIQGIPQKLPLPITCTIRGEAETPVSVFKKVSEKLGNKAKANPRAHTAGSMNLKTAEEMKDRGLQFKAYNILNLEKPPYKTEIERAKWASKTLQLDFVKIISFSYDSLELFENQHRRLDFMVDGVVISLNNLLYQDNLGNTGNKKTGNPKGKVAYKFKDEVKNATVKDVIWQTGRTGNITPVLIFNGIQLEGTVVSKCTAHNLGIIKNNKIGVGSEIEIIKSGKIIPKIHKVVKAKGSASIPKNCPSCNNDLKEVDGADGALSLVCDSSDCPAQNVKNINHWMKILGVKGIAGSTIEKLIDAGLVQKPGDFYRLTIKKIIDVGITQRTATLIVARVWMVPSPEQEKDDKILSKIIDDYSSKRIKIKMEKFFAAFGMKNAGKEAGRILAKEIGDWSDIKDAKLTELEAIDGIGPIMAQEIVLFFLNNKDMIEDVEQFFEFEKVKTGGKLGGKSFVLSGAVDGGKNYWRREIENNGGEVKSSMSKKVDYLIAGEGSGSKSDKAKELKIPILEVEDLEKMLEN